MLIVENTDRCNAVIFVKDSRRKCNIANGRLQVDNTTVVDRIFFQIFEDAYSHLRGDDIKSNISLGSSKMVG
jgi:hypothetical protein